MSKVMHNCLVPLWNSLGKSALRDDCATAGDLAIFQHRAHSEGLPFLTDGLAGLSSALLRGLHSGVFNGGTEVAGFKTKVGSTLPLFLYSAWSKVFNDDGTGIGATFESDSQGCQVLKDWRPHIEAAVAVRWLRQLTCCFSKMRLPHEAERTQAALDRFVANEEQLTSFKGALWRTNYAKDITYPHSRNGSQTLESVLLSARRLVHKVLCNVDPRDITPRHGSGASACMTRPWERYDRILFHPDQNRIWPWLEFAAAGKEHCSQLLSTDFITDGYPRIARGVFVPKDYRGPRLISCEPATSMYYQQGLMTLLVEHLETYGPTRGFVNFTDQTINQVLARESSVNREYGTLDLKDASDLLSWDLIILLWPKHWLDALSAVRSRVTEITGPDGKVVKVPLRKHAPMGSAVCFPVMALTIWALIRAARFSDGPGRKAWIYGDDIVVASQDAGHVCSLLEAVGLKVNRDKSFYGSSPFRESCGKEYWDGFDTTPVYCRFDPTTDDTAVGSLCSFANNLAQNRGYILCADTTELVHNLTGAPIIGCWDDGCVGGHGESDLAVLGLQAAVFSPIHKRSGEKPYPHVILGAMYLCQRDTLRRRNETTSLGGNFQRWVYRVRCPRPVDVCIKPESWGYVLRSSLIGGDIGFTEAVALTKRVQYKWKWIHIPHHVHPLVSPQGTNRSKPDSSGLLLERLRSGSAFRDGKLRTTSA